VSERVTVELDLELRSGRPEPTLDELGTALEQALVFVNIPTPAGAYRITRAVTVAAYGLRSPGVVPDGDPWTGPTRTEKP